MLASATRKLQTSSIWCKLFFLGHPHYQNISEGLLNKLLHTLSLYLFGVFLVIDLKPQTSVFIFILLNSHVSIMAVIFFPASCHYPVSCLMISLSQLPYLGSLIIGIHDFTSRADAKLYTPSVSLLCVQIPSIYSWEREEPDLFGFCIFFSPLYVRGTNKVNFVHTFKCFTF